MVISPISIRLQGVIHGKEAASKIPREELWCHQVSLEKPEGDLRRPDGAGPEGHDTPHTIRGSRPRKKADRPAFGEDTTQATSVGQETSQSESARDGLHQPEYAYLARMVWGLALISALKRLRAGCTQPSCSLCARYPPEADPLPPGDSVGFDPSGDFTPP